MVCVGLMFLLSTLYISHMSKNITLVLNNLIFTLMFGCVDIYIGINRVKTPLVFLYLLVMSSIVSPRMNENYAPQQEKFLY